MTDPGGADSADLQPFLTFEVDRQLYAVASQAVSEIIPTPRYAKAPFTPTSLLGLANLRGAVTPLASVRAMLGRPPASEDSPGMAVVLGGPTPIALAVDRVASLAMVAAADLQSPQAQVAASGGEPLTGLFRTPGGDIAKVLDLDALIAASFDRLGTGVRASAPSRPERSIAPETVTAERRRLISFAVAGQAFALDLDQVLEIISPPAEIVAVPDSDSAVLGVCAWRGVLLPLLSLRALIGLPEAREVDGSGMVVVTTVASARVGLICDRMLGVIAADPAAIEATPSVVAARIGGEAKVTAIYRADDGGGLIAILAVEQLFRETIMTRLGKALAAPGASDTSSPAAPSQRFLVFRLGDEEFGLPIAAVDEVAEAPETVTPLPHAPDFLEGVVNLRGAVLPVVDQRRRFGLAPIEPGRRRRLVAVRTGGHRAGLLVDTISGILDTDADGIEPTSPLAGDAARLISGVANLRDQGRLVLILDPVELLSAAERDLLDAWRPAAGPPPP